MTAGNQHGSCLMVQRPVKSRGEEGNLFLFSGFLCVLAPLREKVFVFRSAFARAIF
jgi:hypothetical protein